MKQIVIVALGFLIATQAGAANPWSPSVEFGARTITVAPAKFHLSPSKTQLEIVESEGCESKVVSTTSLQFSEICDFLRGVYHYSFLQAGNDNKLEVYSEFMIHQTQPKSRTYLVNSPVVIQNGVPLGF